MSNSPLNKSNNSPTHSVNFTISAAQGINTSPSPPRCHVYIISCTVPGSESLGSHIPEGSTASVCSFDIFINMALCNYPPPPFSLPPGSRPPIIHGNPASPNLCIMIGLPLSALSPRPPGRKIKKEPSLLATTLNVFMSFLVVCGSRGMKWKRRKSNSSPEFKRSQNLRRRRRRLPLSTRPQEHKQGF